MSALRNLTALALKQVLRHRTRSALTLLGVASGMFLFTLVETLQASVRRATETQAGEQSLIVYRENRFCPFTSNLPEHYLARLRAVPGVGAAVPVKVVVNNCNTSLDVVTFRGVPRDALATYATGLRLVAGSEADWAARGDAVLLGETFAQRRRLSVGDTFDAAGITVHVAGIIDSDRPELNNVGFVHLDFLQQSTRAGLGVVTQFTVRVAPGHDPKRVSAAIDATFANDQDPTHTRPEKAFFAEIAKDLVQMSRFTRWVGLGAVAAVLGLIANTILLVVRSRVRDNAVMRTLGYPRLAIGWLVVVEGMLFGLAGGTAGVLAAAAFFHWQAFTVGSEGLTISLIPEPATLLAGLGVAVAMGLVAGLVPAWQAMRQPIVRSLRSG